MNDWPTNFFIIPCLPCIGCL